MELSELTDERIRLLVSRQKDWFCDTNAGQLMDISCGNQTYIWGYDHFCLLWAVHGTKSRIAWVNHKNNESAQEVDKLASIITTESGLHSVAWAVSGTDGVELAFYIKDKYWKKHNPNKQDFVSFKPGYSGTSFLAQIIRGEFEVPFAHIVDTGVWPTLDARQYYESRALSQVRDLLKNNRNIGTVFMESMPWSEKFRPWSDTWWKEIRKLCDEYECLMIVDDVMGGYGKTGSKFTHHNHNVLPDLVISAKSLTGGYAPLSSVCVSKEVTESILKKFEFSHTWSPNMAGIGAALWIHKFWPDQTAFDNITQNFQRIIKDRLTNGDIKQGWHQGVICSMELTDPLQPLDLIQAGIMPSGYGSYYDNNHLTICAPVGCIDSHKYWDDLNERLDNALGNT